MRFNLHLTRILSRAAMVLALGLGLEVAFAQGAMTGIIAGRASNPAAGSFLANVRVTVEGSAIEDHTNVAGEFRLVGVPAGDVTVRVYRGALDDGGEGDFLMKLPRAFGPAVPPVFQRPRDSFPPSGP